MPFTEKKDSVQVIEHIWENIGCPPYVQCDILQAEGRVEDALTDWEGDIVIARGLSFSILKKKDLNFHLIKCAVPNMEILKAIHTAVNDLRARHIALFLGHGTVSEVAFWEQLCQVKIQLFTVENDDEATEKFHEMQANGTFDTVVGGYTVCRIAAKNGIQSVPLKMGEESARNAIHEALSVVEANRREKQRSELLNRTIEMMEEGVLSLDTGGRIVMINQACRQMLGMSQKNILGTPARDLIPDSLLKLTENNTIVKLGSKNVLARKENLLIDGDRDGTVLMLQYVEALQKKEAAVRRKLNEKGLVAKYHFSDISGSSATIKRTIDKAQRFAQTDSDILIIGETGTGKELLAQSIHNASNRSKQPFVAFNCGAISSSLIESELFGYVGGAFTGASKEGKVGLFELAHKGTLFMDEIGELPMALQASLLRVLQEKEIRRLGDDKIIPIDVRVIAATNVNIREKAFNGTFRMDLYYRLDVLHLRLPPLRDRLEDIPELVGTLTAEYQVNGQPIQFEPGAMKLLQMVNWAGNVRQLRNACQRLCILNQTGIVTEGAVADMIEESEEELTTAPLPALETKDQQLYELVHKKETKEELAKRLGVSRSTLWRKTRENKNETDVKQK